MRERKWNCCVLLWWYCCCRSNTQRAVFRLQSTFVVSSALYRHHQVKIDRQWEMQNRISISAQNFSFHRLLRTHFKCIFIYYFFLVRSLSPFVTLFLLSLSYSLFLTKTMNLNSWNALLYVEEFCKSHSLECDRKNINVLNNFSHFI